jgi:hypothetical protein
MFDMVKKTDERAFYENINLKIRTSSRISFNQNFGIATDSMSQKH